MDRVIFIGFDTEQKAAEGDRALRDLHKEGLITIYNDAVVVKQRDGKVAVRERPDAGPVATAGGMLTGALIGVLGGPVGAAIGVGAGALLGSAFDLSRMGVTNDFVEDAGAHLEPGKAAVLAEIDEDWETPLDSRIEAIGGTVVRRTPTEVGDAMLEREIEAAQREVAKLEAESLVAVKTTQTEKAARKSERLQAKIDAAKARVREKEHELAAKMQSVKEEGQEKVATLEAQKKTTSQDAQAQLDRRLKEVQGAYDRRLQALKDAQQRLKASRMTSAT